MTQRSAKFLEAISANKAASFEEAVRLMRECAEAGDPVACFVLSLWHRDGDGTPADDEESSKWLLRVEELAEAGNAEAQWELGQNYRFGNLLPLDIERANYWLERAAESGDANARHHLAWYLEVGEYGFPIDTELAQKWYQRAFAQDNPETLYLYAIRDFEDGKQTVKAIQLLRKAAATGFLPAKDILNQYTH
jgi:TPR repeat protein